MVRLLKAGFQVLVLGLNLMAIRYVLLITSPNTVETSDKLVLSGSVITFVGFAIIIVGIIPLFLRRLIAENATILAVGPSVVTLGIAMIIRAIGHGNETIIFIFAWSATGVGIALVFAYCMWYIFGHWYMVKSIRFPKFFKNK